MSIVAPDFVLRILRDADACKDADDGNDNQKFYEGEAPRIFVCWMFMHDHSLLMAGNEAILQL